MTKNVPPHMIDFILPFDWDVRKVWDLQAAIRKAPIAHFEFLVANPFWSKNSESYTDFDLCPSDVLSSSDLYPKHLLRVKEADTNWALDLIQHDGRLWILDGIHRLVHLKLLGASDVRFRTHPISVCSQIEYVA